MLIPEGQTGDDLEFSKKECFVWHRGTLAVNILPLFLVFKVLSKFSFPAIPYAHYLKLGINGLQYQVVIWFKTLLFSGKEISAS
jgi:hypothetical protein